MFKQKIVFVVGAGASKEYGLPLGSELKERIADAVRFRYQHGFELISGSVELLNHIKRHVANDRDRANRYTKAGSILANSIPSFISVDEALHYVSETPEAVEVGKIAIVNEILRAERESALSYDPQRGRLAQLPNGWIGEMFSIVISQIRRQNLRHAFDHVAFVNFNYDRAIEQYLYWALQERTSADAGEAAEIVRGLNMIRPYGSIGSYAANMNDPLAFGTTAYFDPFSRLSDLGTYTDPKPKHDSAAMHNAISDAKLIIFLGFGFHSSNLDLVSRAADTSQSTSVLGTVKGIHHSNHSLIESRIKQNLKSANSNVDLYDMTASELLRELRPRIQMLSS